MTGLEIILTVLCVILIGVVAYVQYRRDRVFEAFAILVSTIMRESEWSDTADVEEWIERVWDEEDL